MEHTLITIIISTHNRAGLLDSTLPMLLQQKGMADYSIDVIVVDNNSTDNTREVVQKWQSASKVPILYLLERRKGKPNALNTAVRHANGDVIILLDDDVILDDNWLKEVISCYKETRFDAMGGRLLPKYPANTPKWIIENRDILSGPVPAHDYGEQNREYDGTMISFLGANMAVKKNALKEIGMYRDDIGAGLKSAGDDSNVFIRLKNAGKKIVYCGKACVWHPVSPQELNLWFIAKWNIHAGRYMTYVAIDELVAMPRLFGVPRYLVKDLCQKILGAIFNLFNRRKFIVQYSRLFQDVGQMKGFREKIK